jgi:adenosylhomocysteine nucleosidase
MKKIGIIAAMQEEKNAIVDIMQNIKNTNIYELTFIEGLINSKECVLVESGVGKVNAARTTQILLDKYDIEFVVNVGSAGTASDLLNIGDIVIGKNLVQHDFDITAFDHPKGYISNVGLEIKSDTSLVKKIEIAIEKIKHQDFKIKIGTIASGDIFCTNPNMKEKINQKFNADAIEMEGAAIAQVCYLDSVPFVVIRSISDSPNNNNNITFDEYLDLASKRCAIILREFIE